MENFNTAVVSRLIEYIENILERIEASTNGESKIQLTKHQSIDSNNLSINYLTSHGMTGTFTLKLYFRVEKDGEVSEYDEDLEIPKLINNVFVIDGAFRVPTSTLDNDDSVTTYTNNIRINELLNIEFEEDEHEPGGYKITAHHYLDEEEVIIDCSDENMENHKNLFKLEQFEIDKIKVKLDTDDVGEYLTRDILLGLIKLGSDKRHDNMIDKKIYSTETNFMKYMWSRDVRRRVLTSMKNKYYQYNKIFLRDIQNAITRYFKIASERDIDIPSTINPLVFDAMKYKVTIAKNVTFNRSMTDIIDVTNTPINGNVNKLNELNVCAEIKDDTVYIKCYEYPSQNPISIPYTTYCTKKVILNTEWDYDKKEFKSGLDTIQYKLRIKVRQGSKNESYDLIEPKADDKLSLTTRRIPLGNFSDSIRVSMATSFYKQAVELSNSEPALISSGHDDEDFELSTQVTRFTGTKAVVDKIKGNKIFLKDLKDGSIDFVEVPAPSIGANNSIISFDSVVKEGQVVVKDQPLVVPNMLRNRSFELGINLNVVYFNYLGFTYEDATVISESVAKKLTHYQIIDVYQDIYPDDIIKYIKKIGSKVKSRDVLVNNQSRLRVSKSVKEIYEGSGMLQGMGIAYNQANLLVPNNIDEGYVIACKIEFGKNRELTSEESKKTIKEWRSGGKSTDYDHLPDKFKILEPNSVELRDKVAGYISFKILKVDTAKPGDKLTNRYGSKGIISLVMPDNCMPQIERDGVRTPVDMILNPSAIIRRKNISQLYEAALSKCIKAIYAKVSQFIEFNNIKGAKEFLNKYYGAQFDKLSDKAFIENHNRGLLAYQMNVGFYSKVTYDEVIGWMKELGISESDTIYCPDIITYETPDGIRACLPEEYKQEPNHRKVKRYDLGYCDSECVTGVNYVIKLYHSAQYSSKATPNIMEVAEPVMGRGNYRDSGGQKIGEMEAWVLLETGAEEFLQKQSPDMVTNQYLFLNELLMAGYTISDPSGIPLLTQQQSRAKALEDLDKATK